MYIYTKIGVESAFVKYMKVRQRPLYIVHIFTFKIDHVGIIRFYPLPICQPNP